MIDWHPHTHWPTGPETALIAIRPPKDFLDDAEKILLGEVYRYDVPAGRWVGEWSGLLLKHTEFWWASETDLLVDLPS